MRVALWTEVVKPNRGSRVLIRQRDCGGMHTALSGALPGHKQTVVTVCHKMGDAARTGAHRTRSMNR
jgi:hypothetical protein